MLRRILIIPLLALTLLACHRQLSKNLKHPNILVIVADDLGYSDIGAFGSEISTPHMDALSREGIILNNFHTAPMCAVTRAMLLSGNDNHIAGMGSQDLSTEVFGYEGHLSDRIVPVPALLQKAGYKTCMAGKWHLGTSLENNPVNKGFDRSYVCLISSANHYTDTGLFQEDPVTPYTEDGLDTHWPQGAYSTDFYTDKLIAYLTSFGSGKKPFFAFAAYTSPHWPLQVDTSFWYKYRSTYDEGYEKLRIERHQKLKDNALIPKDAELPELHPDVRPWNSLDSLEKRIEVRKMEIYAGMVDNLDYNIGRLINYLKETGQYDNTLIIFLSDNGAAGEDFYYHPRFGPFLQKHYTDNFDSFGNSESFVSYGPQWAEAGTSMFKYFKGYMTEGGIRTPCIIKGPEVLKGHTSSTFTSVLDIAPTLYHYAGIEYPEEFNGVDVSPLKGVSLEPVMTGNSNNVHDDNYVFALEHRGQIVVRKGSWKLVNNKPGFDLSNFCLYNLESDSAEKMDLKNSNPSKFSELLSEWELYKNKVRVQYPTPKAAHN